MFPIIALLVCLVFAPLGDCSSYDCNSHDACVLHHLSQPTTQRLLRQIRCKFNKVSWNRDVTFTHIPKTGGTTITAAFRERTRFVGYSNFAYAHIPFLNNSQSSMSLSTYFTIFRNPLDRAVSLWNYIRSFPYQESHNGDLMWSSAFEARSFSSWLSIPIVRDNLASSSLHFFPHTENNINRSIYNWAIGSQVPTFYHEQVDTSSQVGRDSATSGRVRKKMSQTPYLDKFLNYTLSMPPIYRYMKIDMYVLTEC
jgi:hypothetical protein